MTVEDEVPAPCAFLATSGEIDLEAGVRHHDSTDVPSYHHDRSAQANLAQPISYHAAYPRLWRRPETRRGLPRLCELPM